MAYITKAKKKSNNRKQERQKLYQCKQWRALSQWMRMEHPICQRCNERLTEAVHHKKSPFEYGLSYAEKCIVFWIRTTSYVFARNAIIFCTVM